MYSLPPIKHIRRDLVAHLYAWALVQERCVRAHTSRQLLNLPGDAYDTDFVGYDNFDLTGFWVGDPELAAVYRYASLGEHSGMGQVLSMDPDEGAIGRLSMLVRVFVGVSEVSYCLNEVTGSYDRNEAPRGGLPEMVALAMARARLDEGFDLTPVEVALLAALSERSVANAMAMSGDAKLNSGRNEKGQIVIKADEAHRWLSGRRAYLPSVLVRSTKGLPQAMDAKALSAFIVERIRDEVSDEGLDFQAMAAGVQTATNQRAAKLVRVLGWPMERVQRWIDGKVAELELDDCAAMAGVMWVDQRWLTDQLMGVLSPNAHQQIDVTLTDAGIRNGYFDIEQRYARGFFPGDVFGGRGSDEVASTVRLTVDGQVFDTDIRLKSEALVSPRKRFSGYFKSHQAKPGHRVRITRTGERDYELTFVDQG